MYEKIEEFMTVVPVRFVISEISEMDLEDLRNNLAIESKMILTPDDFSIFKYQVGDKIQIENEFGNREWCDIVDLETIPNHESTLVMLRLKLTKNYE